MVVINFVYCDVFGECKMEYICTVFDCLSAFIGGVV